MSRITRVFSSPFNPYAASIILAIGSIVFTLLIGGKLWGITTGESQLAGHLMKLIGVESESLPYFSKFKLPAVLTSGPQIHVFALLLGGLVSSLLLGEFALKQIPGKGQLVLAISGGILLGYGSRLAAGCNIGNFWSAFPSAGLNAVTFFAGVLIGAFAAVKTIVDRVLLPMRRTHVTFSLKIQKPLGLVILLAVAVFPLLLNLSYIPALWFWFGVFAAYVGYRGRLCFASAYRDLFVSGVKSGSNAAAVALGLILQTLLIVPLLVSGYKFDLSLASGQGQIQILIGGLLFGVGAVLLGGCIFSSAYRAGAGSIAALVGWLSTVFVGMPLLSLTWDFWYTSIPRYLPNVTLYSSGIFEGLLVSLLIPVGWLIYAGRVEGRSIIGPAVIKQLLIRLRIAKAPLGA